MVKDKGPGARVIIREIIVSITPEKGWVYKKRVSGTIIGKTEHYYWYSSDGGNGNVRKMTAFNDIYKPYLIKLDEGIDSIQGGEYVVREHDINFLDRIERKRKPIDKKQYDRACKIKEQYERENKH